MRAPACRSCGEAARKIIVCFLLLDCPAARTAAPLADSTIHPAVNRWINNDTNATQQYGTSIALWDVSQVTRVNGLFLKIGCACAKVRHGCCDVAPGADTFRADLSAWDVSSLADARFMFREALAFNSDLSNWDMSSCTSARGMFKVRARHVLGNTRLFRSARSQRIERARVGGAGVPDA